MSIELIDTIRPKNNQGFAIALSNDLKGGIHHAETLTERDGISVDRLQNGMLCYVENDGMYQYIDGVWNVFQPSSTQNNYVVETRYDLLQLDTSKIELGSICYVKNDEFETYIYYLSVDGWKGISTSVSSIKGNLDIQGYYIGETEPENTNLIWIDTSSTAINSSFYDLLFNEMRSLMSEIKDEISSLKLNVIELQNENNTMRVEIETLKEVVKDGVIVNPDNGSGNTLLLEDGSVLITEDGNTIILEN